MFMKTRIFPPLALALAMAAFSVSSALSAPAPASGPAPKLLGKFKDWSAYSMDQNNHTVCFATSEPKSTTLSDKSASRGDPFFLVTNWPGKPLQPSLIMGYPQSADKHVKIKIGNDNFEMFVQNDGAWMETEDGDKKLTDAMRKGAIMMVDGESAKGTKSTDRYSLAGISSALEKVSACK